VIIRSLRPENPFNQPESNILAEYSVKVAFQGSYQLCPGIDYAFLPDPLFRVSLRKITAAANG
jgi:hypothetical protein